MTRVNVVEVVKDKEVASTFNVTEPASALSEELTVNIREEESKVTYGGKADPSDYVAM